MQPHPFLFFAGFVMAGFLLHMAAGNARFNDDQKAKLEAIARAWGISHDRYLKFCQGGQRITAVIGLIVLATLLIIWLTTRR